jgi:ABC-type glycerol-3-phosphate transport system permease component
VSADIETLNRIAWRAAAYLAVALLVFVFGFPLFWMISASFKPPAEMFVSPPTLLPAQWTLRNYADLFAQTEFLRYFANSLIVACGATALSLLIGALGAYALSRFRDRFALLRWFGNGTLVAYMLPEVLLVIPLYIALINIGLADTLFVLIVANLTFTLPLTLWYMQAYFRAIPPSVEEAAMVEGCSRLGAFRRVVLPLALPGLVATSVFSFNHAWNDFLFALVFTSSETNKVLPLGLATWIGNDNVYAWGMLMAAAVLITAPVVLVFLAAQGKLVAGLAEGGTKGG